MPPNYSVHLNRVGLILDFLSFWLAAPEILGEDRLRAVEATLKRGLKGWLQRAPRWFSEFLSAAFFALVMFVIFLTGL